MPSVTKQLIVPTQNIFDIAEICTLPARLCAGRLFTSKCDKGYLTEFAIRSLTLLTSIYASPLYLIGHCIKQLEAKSDRQEVLPAQAAVGMAQRTAEAAAVLQAPIPPPPSYQNAIQQPALLPPLAPIIAPLPPAPPQAVIPNNQQVAIQLVNELGVQLGTFSKDSTWEEYKRLPQLLQTLIASRQYYPNYGWSFTSCTTLLKDFEVEFKDDAILIGAKRGIQEGIEYYVRCQTLLEVEQSNHRRNTLLTFDQKVIDQVYWHVAGKFGCTNEDQALEFGKAKFTTNPNHKKVTKALKQIREHIEKGWDIDSRLMLPSPPQPQRRDAIQE